MTTHFAYIFVTGNQGISQMRRYDASRKHRAGAVPQRLFEDLVTIADLDFNREREIGDGGGLAVICNTIYDVF